MTKEPLVVQCCHCRWCQRDGGASFALNALIEAEQVVLICGEPEIVNTPSLSGKGQKISRCPNCRIAVWGNYAGSGDRFRFVRVGTLDAPDVFPSDVHIFTVSKQPWLTLPDGAPTFAEFYNREEIWSAASLRRLTVVLRRQG